MINKYLHKSACTSLHEDELVPTTISDLYKYNSISKNIHERRHSLLLFLKVSALQRHDKFTHQLPLSASVSARCRRSRSCSASCSTRRAPAAPQPSVPVTRISPRLNFRHAVEGMPSAWSWREQSTWMVRPRSRIPCLSRSRKVSSPFLDMKLNRCTSRSISK